MDADGSNVKQFTHELGYDGGPFWSYHGTKIVYRAEHPKTPEEQKDYKDLLAQGLIRPGNLEISVRNSDGSDKHQVAYNGTANFSPYWLLDDQRIILASSQADPKNGRDFDLYIKNEAGMEQERITYHPNFDGFPMFTSNGKRFVWAPIEMPECRTKPTFLLLTGWNNRGRSSNTWLKRRSGELARNPAIASAKLCTF